jgi:hypothetical protein
MKIKLNTRGTTINNSSDCISMGFSKSAKLKNSAVSVACHSCVLKIKDKIKVLY